MNVIVELLKTCIPIIIGALIAIVPTMIEKNIEHDYLIRLHNDHDLGACSVSVQK